MAVVTKTLKSSGGDYSLISTWESTEQTDLVSAGDTHVLECYTKSSGDWGAVTIAGWTTGASNFITITVPEAERWDFQDKDSGTKASGRWYLTNYTVVEYMVLDNGYFVQLDGNQYCFARNCAVFGSTSSRPYAIHYTENCLAVGGTTWDHFYSVAGSASTYKNCTSIDSPNRGFAGGTPTNCVSYGSTGAGFASLAGGDYCAADDTSSPGSNSVDNITSAAFTNYAGSDYSVSGTGSALYDAGTDLSGTFTDDITGATRSQWDIGAYEYISVGGATNPKGPLGHPLHGPFGGPV